MSLIERPELDELLGKISHELREHDRLSMAAAPLMNRHAPALPQDRGKA